MVMFYVREKISCKYFCIYGNDQILYATVVLVIAFFWGGKQYQPKQMDFSIILLSVNEAVIVLC